LDYLTELYVCITTRLQIKIYKKSVLRIQRRNGLDATPMADSRINNRLIKCIHSSIRRVLSSSASYFIVCVFSIKYLIPQNYSTTSHPLSNW